MPDFLSDYNKAYYKTLAIGTIKPNKIHTGFLEGTPNGENIIQVVGNSNSTDLSLAINEELSDVLFTGSRTMITLFAGRGVRDQNGKHSNYLRLSSVGNQYFEINSFIGNGHKDTATKALPVSFNVGAGNNVSFYQENTIFNKPVVLSEPPQITGWDTILLHNYQSTGSGTDYQFDIDNNPLIVPQGVYLYTIEVSGATVANDTQIWTAKGTVILSFVQQQLYVSSPPNPITINWLQHHRSIDLPTVTSVLGNIYSGNYYHYALKFKFAVATKASFIIKAKRLA